MPKFTILLAIVAALLHGVGYALYNVQTKLGKSDPNIASWIIWVFLAGLNAMSYSAMDGDWIAGLQFFMGTVACIVTFCHVLAIGKFDWPKPAEWVACAVGLLAVFVWWEYQSAVWASVVVAAGFILSAIPTGVGVWRDPYKERPPAWMFWTVASLATVVVVVLRAHGTLLQLTLKLIMPIGSTVLHGGVAVLCRADRRARFPRPDMQSAA